MFLGMVLVLGVCCSGVDGPGKLSPLRGRQFAQSPGRSPTQGVLCAIFEIPSSTLSIVPGILIKREYRSYM